MLPFAPLFIAAAFSATGLTFSTLGLTVFIIVELIWLAAVIHIAREKTADPFDRVVWLMIVLSLNIIGAILYILFSPVNVIDPNRYSPYPRSARQARRRNTSQGSAAKRADRDSSAHQPSMTDDGKHHSAHQPPHD